MLIQYVCILFYVLKEFSKNSVPEANVVIAGSFAMSYFKPFFLDFFLLRDPVGEKKLP